MFIKKALHNLYLFSLAAFFSFLLFYLFLHPLNPAYFLGSKLLAATGITNSATVPLNPINKLAAQLDSKEKELAQREQTVAQREAAAVLASDPWHNKFLLGVIIGLAILSFLLAMNFYFDARRKAELELLEQLEKKQRAFGP